MRVRGPFLLAGALWGLILAACVGYATSAFVAGFAWLYLFGDSAWPPWAEDLVLGAGLTVAVGLFLAGLWLGQHFARRAEAAPERERVRRRRGAWIAVSAAMAATLLGLAALSLANLRHERARAQLGVRQAFYETLRNERQGFAEIASTAVPAERSLRIDIATEGIRGGRHRLTWVLVAPGYNAVLAEGSREDWLAPGGNELRVAVDATAIIGAYHRVALGGGEVNVEVDETLRIELALTPLPEGDDLTTLPPEQRHNLEIGESDLTDRRAARVGLRFAIRDGDYRLLE